MRDWTPKDEAEIRKMKDLYEKHVGPAGSPPEDLLDMTVDEITDHVAARTGVPREILKGTAPRGMLPFDDDAPQPVQVVNAEEWNTTRSKLEAANAELAHRQRVITSLENAEAKLVLELDAAKNRADLLSRELAQVNRKAESLQRQLGRRNDRRGSGRRF